MELRAARPRTAKPIGSHRNGGSPARILTAQRLQGLEFILRCTFFDHDFRDDARVTGLEAFARPL
jgi:hypothetical protein